MVQQKLEKLQRFLQGTADTAWTFSMQTSLHDPNPTPFGEHFEFLLQSNDAELSVLLQEVAQAQLHEQQSNPEPPDFHQYIRYSSNFLDHKEIFVGNEWVLVPADACVDFFPTTMGSGVNAQSGFRVEISHGNDYVTFESTESLKQYQENELLLNDQQITVELQDTYVSKEEFDWMRAAVGAYQFGKKNVNGLGDVVSLYDNIPKEFKRTYAYKISKAAKKLGKPAKAGKIFHGAEKLAKKGSKIAKVGPYLTAGTIGYEVLTDTWDAHTVVDGTLLVVGIAAASVGAPVVIVGIAIYGILDYAFDISEGIDETFGRNSGFWDKKPLRSFPTNTTPLFNEIKIDNTAVKKPFRIPPQFKN
ncbi:hypothetical protein GCM10009117_25640 [Gangjinia marincola]|uniref:Uncharacterized protein n=1 Tax=Gangjinia marincola TaxID=578463 RepID=A0ABN1MKA7_9FLAO